MTPSPRVHSLTVLVSTALVVSACASSSPTEPIEGLPRQLTAAEQSIVSNANRFGFDLFRSVHADVAAPNVVLSPLSAAMALGMALNGAAGETWDGMRQGLRLGGLSQEEINGGFESLIELLTGLDPRVRFDIGNSVWTRQGFPVLPSFHEVVASSFDAEARELDFDSPSAVTTINEWVRAATNGRIEKAIDAISYADMMFLINAIYFDGEWSDRFDAARTRAEPFRLADGSTVSVPMMSQKTDVSASAGTGWRAIELGYGGGAYGMVIVLPDENRPLASLVADFDETWWAGVIAALQPAELEIALPKLELEFDAYLNDPLIGLGMAQAFTPAADFSRLTPTDVCIQFVRQKTFLKVDERGTEAAAVTTVGVGVTSAPVPFRADRPFLFAIRERFSGAILFMGTIGDPTRAEAPAPEKPPPPC